MHKTVTVKTMADGQTEEKPWFIGYKPWSTMAGWPQTASSDIKVIVPPKKPRSEQRQHKTISPGSRLAPLVLFGLAPLVLLGWPSPRAARALWCRCLGGCFG
jgi:hypothetical protein